MDSERHHRERYRRACELFDAALTLPSVERDAFLQAACSADQDLRHEVARMVEHDRRATGLLDRSPIQRIDDGHTPQAPHLAVGQLEVGQLEVGTGLGAYRIARTLGQGGMGVVYLATRDDDVFERAVAIKVVREATTDEEGPWRFRREREILARLEHPYIARLYDGGITENQQPYLVMEYVEGLAITTYCDHHRLAIGDRLALMRKVCLAVQYAHRNLVVHRDLKPSNILVNADGDPKLLDFGIAKLLDPGNASTNRELTREQRQVMTLSHASPEQVACRAVTTATDVYGLGLILYELLCGVAPFALDSPSTYELLRLICEQPPQAPSAMIRRLTTVPDTARENTAQENTDGEDTGHESMDDDVQGEALPTATSVAAGRSTSADKLRGRLVGDLDAIVSMALRKEPEKRYASVTQLAEDLARHLDDRPVVARTKATRYRVGKFLRRHRAAVTVGVTLASLLAGLALAFVLTMFAQVERTVREKDKAEQLLAFLIETFAVADPDAAVGETVTARELLDQGARRVATELEGEPELRAMMLDAMGQIYYQIGLFAPAESLLRESLEHRSGLAPGSPAATAARMTHLGAVLRDAGKLEEAEATLRSAIAMGELQDQRPGLADSLEGLAFLRRFQYDYEETEALYRRAVKIRRAMGDPRKTARTLTDLGILLREKGGFDSARAALREALALRQKHLGASHPEVANSLMEWANLEHAQGQYARAEALKHRALRIAIAVHGENHRAVIDIKNALALTLGQSGKDDEASALLAECVEGLRQLAGTEQPDFATMASNLAVMLTKLGRYERAEALFREALDIRLRLFGEGHPYVGQTHLTWGLLEHRRGALASAEAHYRQAADAVARLPAGHRAIAYPKMAMAELLIDRGQADEAESMLDEVLTELRTSHEPTHWRIAMAEAHLGRAHATAGKLESAEAHLRSALATLRSVEGNDPTRQRRVLEWLIALDLQSGRTEQAEEHARLLAAMEESASSATLRPSSAER